MLAIVNLRREDALRKVDEKREKQQLLSETERGCLIAAIDRYGDVRARATARPVSVKFMECENQIEQSR